MSEKKKREELKIIAVKLPIGMLEQIDDLIRAGRYVNRSEFIRNAIRNELAKARRGKK